MPLFNISGVLSAPFMVHDVDAESKELALHDVLGRDPTELVGMATGPSSIGTMNAIEQAVGVAPSEGEPAHKSSRGRHKASDE